MAGNGGVGDFDDFDDEFSDDTFDNLPANTLQALEREALLSTQRPRTAETHAANTLRSPAALQLPGRPPPSSLPDAAGNHPRRIQPVYAFNQEDVINLDEYPHVPQQNFGSQVDRSNLGSQWGHHTAYGGSGSYSNTVHRAVKQNVPQASSASNVTELQARIHQLERERAALKQAADAAKAAAQTKTGEAANLRQRFDKTTRDYEQKLAALRQSHSEVLAKQNAELQAVQAERQKVVIERTFLENEVREVGRKVPRAGSGRTRTLTTDLTKTALTPRRVRTQPIGDGFGDGFDDEHITLSPSKKKDQSKPVTPGQKLEKKRKRDEPSPSIPAELPLSEPRPEPSPISSFSPFAQKPAVDTADGSTTAPSKNEAKLQFLQDLINHRVPGSQDRFFEALIKYALPSEPDTTFSTLVLDQLSQRTFLSSEEDSSVVFCDIMLSLWDKSLKEEYHAALDLITHAIQYVVDSERFSFARTLVEKVVPLAKTTINRVALQIGRAAAEAKSGIVSRSHSPIPEIDIAPSLNLLYSIAIACTSSPDHVNAFWSRMGLHFVLLLLMKAQQIDHIKLMLSLLRTSILPTSFGAIIAEEELDPTHPDQNEAEAHTIDRLTSLLLETVTSSDPNNPLEFEGLITFHLEVLETLQEMCITSRSSLALANQRSAIGRLIHFLHDSIDALYSPATTLTAIHDLTIQCVNTTMRLLYHLLTTHADKIDVREKLRAVEGGTHMHLIALTRLAFCESVILERGIEPEVSDAAHALLDEFLSPVEGEQLLVMFASGESATAAGEPTAMQARDFEDESVVGHTDPMDIVL